jgi:hypothetical protein
MSTRWSLSIALCLVILAVSTTLLIADDKQNDMSIRLLEEQLKALLEERVQTAFLCLSATQAAFEAETVSLGDLLDAMEKLENAELSMVTKPEQEIATMKRHVTRLQQVEKKIELLYRVGTKGGEAKEYSRVKRERESAEIAVLKARIKAQR